MKKRIILLLFFIFAFGLQIEAQEPPIGADIGAQAERYKREVQEEIKRHEKAPTPPEIKIEEAPQEPALEGAAFILKAVKISGVSVFNLTEFIPVYQSYLNKEITFKDIEVIISGIKSQYNAKGYLTTTAYLPEQDIVEGAVEIRVAEGRMGNLVIEGNKSFSSALIEKYFHSKKNEILNIKKLQRDILRLNQNADLEIKTILSAGSSAQTSDVVLKAKDRFPWHISIAEDDAGTRLTGKYRTSYSLRSSNFSGKGDALFLNTLFTTRSFGQSASYVIPVDTYGTKAGVDFTIFKMKLGKEYKASNISGNTLIWTPYLKKELALTEKFELYANVGMDIKAVKKKTDGVVTANDQLRIPYFEFNMSRRSSSGQTNFNPRFNFSVKNFLGASSKNHPTASRANTAGAFFKYEQTLSHIQRMPFNSYVSLRSQFQAVSHTLPSSEQIQLGGMNSVRGYPEGDYLADMGGGINIDWTYPISFFRPDWTLEPLIFSDIGGGKLKKVASGEKYKKFLAGAGGGIGLRMANRMYLKLEWAKHAGDRPVGGSGVSTFYLTFQAEI